ncbi:MAG: hypothetical protein J5691_01065 [Bacilli bacterium]|nr:hypothetical protein [Bacilli bacterium]
MAASPLLELTLTRDSSNDVINEISALTGAIYLVIGVPGTDEGVTPTITQGTNITYVSGPESDFEVWESIVKVSDIDNFSFSIHCDKYRVYTVTNASISNWSNAGSGTGVDKVAPLEVTMTPTPQDLFGYSEEVGDGAFYAWDNGTTTYYTQSGTPQVGDTIYDDTFTATSMLVTAVNQNGSIEIGYLTLSMTFDDDGGVPVTNSFSIDGGTSYTTYGGGPYTLDVSYGSHTLNTTGAGDVLFINNTTVATVATMGDDISCSFVIAQDGTTVTFTGNAGSIVINVSSQPVVVTIGRGLSCCVKYDTPIDYYDGTTKNAEDVRVGDKILGYDEKAQVFVEVEVLGIKERIKHEMVHVVTPNHIIDITVDHPILTNQGWAVYNSHYNSYKDLNKIDLTYGLKLLTSDNTYEDILSIDHYTIDEPLKTYTFDVTNGIDTYVTGGLISHNAPEKC